jgi:hypothetical protein
VFCWWAASWMRRPDSFVESKGAQRWVTHPTDMRVGLSGRPALFDACCGALCWPRWPALLGLWACDACAFCRSVRPDCPTRLCPVSGVAVWWVLGPVPGWFWWVGGRGTQLLSSRPPLLVPVERSGLLAPEPFYGVAEVEGMWIRGRRTMGP